MPDAWSEATAGNDQTVCTQDQPAEPGTGKHGGLLDEEGQAPPENHLPRSPEQPRRRRSVGWRYLSCSSAPAPEKEASGGPLHVTRSWLEQGERPVTAASSCCRNAMPVRAEAAMSAVCRLYPDRPRATLGPRSPEPGTCTEGGGRLYGRAASVDDQPAPGRRWSRPQPSPFAAPTVLVAAPGRRRPGRVPPAARGPEGGVGEDLVVAPSQCFRSSEAALFGIPWFPRRERNTMTPCCTFPATNRSASPPYRGHALFIKPLGGRPRPKRHRSFRGGPPPGRTGRNRAVVRPHRRWRTAARPFRLHWELSSGTEAGGRGSGRADQQSS